MNLQTVLAVLILLSGIIYTIFLCRDVWKNRETAKAEKGVAWKISLAEGIVYFFTTMGVPDYLLNNLLFRKTGWVDDRRVPGTLITTCILPSSLIAYVYMNDSDTLGGITLLLCMAAIAVGSFLGARVMTSLDGRTIRIIMAVAMLASMVTLIIKMIVSAGAVGTATSLGVVQLCIALPVIFILGFINSFGIPMKPAATALFLLLGMSPLSALAMMLVMGLASPLAGSIRVLQSGIYQRKVAVVGCFAGLVGAFIGTAVTVTLDQTVLSVILIVIMAFTVIYMLRPEKQSEKE